VRGAAGGIVHLALLPAAFLLGGCAQGPAEAPPPEIRAVADPQAGEALVSMLAAYGGFGAWREHRNVEYLYMLRLYGPGGEERAMTRQVHRFGLGPTVQAYAEDLAGEAPQIVRLDGEALEVTRGGVPLTDPAALAFPKAFVGMARWSFINPWNFLAPGSRLEGRGVHTPGTSGVVPSGPCDVIRLRFDRPTEAGGTDDWYDVYISRLNRLIERVHSYRAQDNSYRIALWSDYRAYGGLRVASRRETHASDEIGAIGPLEAVAEYSDVRFDAPFGDEMFRGGAIAAASARE